MLQLNIEKKWQQAWRDARAFVQDPSNIDSSKAKFFATVPYPYANAALHIGHGRMFTATDIIVRYQRLLGKAVLFPMGFHVSGTPVLAVADGLSRGDEKQKKITREALADYVPDKATQDQLLEEFCEPMKIADVFSGFIEQTTDTIGLSIDWSKKFSTGDSAYQRLVQWQFGALEKCGILEQGRYPILYSTQDKNAVGEDDIKDGDLDKVTILDMSYILFEIVEPASKDVENPCYFAVATLRPDALFGTTNLWVDPKGRYARVKLQPMEHIPGFTQIWLVGEAAVCKLENQYNDVSVLSWHEGKEFVGAKAKTPLTGHVVPIADASFLDPRHGTGLVYSSPAGSPHDYVALKEAQKEGRLSAEIKVINTVVIKDKKGGVIQFGECYAADKVAKYNIKTSTDPRLEECKQELYKEEHYGGMLTDVGDYSGIPIKKAKDAIHASLVAQRLGGTFHETSRRAETRAGQPVIVARLQGQWFLNYAGAEAKSKASALLEKMDYLPRALKHTQKGLLDWVQRRPCARRRGLGTPLPQDPEWVVESLSDSTIYQIFYPLAQFLNEHRISVDDLTPDFLDWIFFGPADAPPPVPARGSPAFECHPATFEEVRRTCRYWGGFDLRCTAATHMSNHLAFLIYHYALMFSEPHQALFHPRNISIGGLLVRDGNKISKTKGNGIPLIQVRERFGADLYRLYIAVGASFDEKLDFRERDVPILSSKFETWKKLMFSAKAMVPKSEAEMTDIDRWLRSKFYSRMVDYWPAMDAMRIREAFVSILFELLKDISYHTRRTSQANTAAVVRGFFVDYLLLMAPVVPHICEELYEGEGPEGKFLSLLAFDRSRSFDQYIDKFAHAIEAIPLELFGMVGSEITKRQKRVNGSLPSPLRIQIVQACGQMFSLFDALRVTLNSTRKAEDVMEAARMAVPDNDWSKCIQKLVPRTLGNTGLQPYLAKDAEQAFLQSSALPFIQSEFPDAEISIVDADMVVDKRFVALPGTPVVVLL